MYSLESPQWGDSNENEQHTLERTTYVNIKENKKKIPIMPPDLALWFKLISSNIPCLEHILMVPKVFEPLKFYCIFLCTRDQRLHVCSSHNQTCIALRCTTDKKSSQTSCSHITCSDPEESTVRNWTFDHNVLEILDHLKPSTFQLEHLKPLIFHLEQMEHLWF